MDEVIGFLLATKNETGWFTTKEYVDYVAIQGVVDQIIANRFTIDDGSLLVTDISEELFAEKFAILDGILCYNAGV